MAVGGLQNGSCSDPVLQKLLASLEQVYQKVDGRSEDQSFLHNLLQSKSLQSLVLIYNRVISHEELCPSSLDAGNLLHEVSSLLSSTKLLRDSRELSTILRDPHIQALLFAHDLVAKKDFLPPLPDIQPEGEEDEETVKIVQLVKSNEPLGATIKFNEATGSIIVARIMHGGAADRSGLIQVGDEVHEVNGISVKGKSPHDVVKILEKSVDGSISFKLIPSEDSFPCRESRVRVRAHFDFDPTVDPIIPCKEAGLPFVRGDILHVVNQEDPVWWQARKEGEINSRAGLIPSAQLQERRMAAMRDLTTQDDGDSLIAGCQSPIGKDKRPRKVKKIMYDAKENDDFDREEIATYEEVAKLYPRPGLHRPIILIGPPGVGRNELKRRLVALDPELYKTTVPHTSRMRKPWEVDGRDYYFVSREYMEQEIKLGRLVEFGEYKGNLYGTSLDTVHSIVNAGYVCVMNPHPQALKLLRTATLKPYIIFIKPPSFEKLKATRTALNARSTFDETSSRGFTDEELHDIIYGAHKLEYLYGHMFDDIIVNDDVSRAFQDLLGLLKQVESDFQWVPASWVT